MIVRCRKAPTRADIGRTVIVLASRGGEEVIYVRAIIKEVDETNRHYVCRLEYVYNPADKYWQELGEHAEQERIRLGRTAHPLYSWESNHRIEKEVPDEGVR